MKIIFYIWLILSAVYVVFNFMDFINFWWEVITVLPVRLWELIKKWTGRNY